MSWWRSVQGAKRPGGETSSEGAKRQRGKTSINLYLRNVWSSKRHEKLMLKFENGGDPAFSLYGSLLHCCNLLRSVVCCYRFHASR